MRLEIDNQMSACVLRLIAPVLLLERNATGAVLECFEMFRALLIIFLMIILGRPKLHCRQDFSRDLFLELAGACELLFRSFRDFLFVIAAIKNCRAITRTDVGKLSV